MDIRDEINLGFIYAGTIIGAGFASGQEIMRFFTAYGRKGLAGIALSCALFFLLGKCILSLAIKNQSVSIRDILLPYAGKKLMMIFEVISDLFLLGGYHVMLSGCGAVLWESVRVPYFAAVIVLCTGCVLWLNNGADGLAEFNKVIVPIMVVLTFLISFNSLKGFRDISYFMDMALPSRSGWLFSALIYVSFNMTSGCVVLSSLGTFTKRRKAACGASFIASGTLFVMALLLYLSTSVHFSELSGVEIPLMHIASALNKELYWLSIVILLCAMLTTALSFGFAFAQSVSRKLRIAFHRALFSLFLGMPFTARGFSGMIGLIYPLFGIIGIFFVFLLICRRFFSLKIE